MQLLLAISAWCRFSVSSGTIGYTYSIQGKIAALVSIALIEYQFIAVVGRGSIKNSSTILLFEDLVSRYTVSPKILSCETNTVNFFVIFSHHSYPAHLHRARENAVNNKFILSDPRGYRSPEEHCSIMCFELEIFPV